MMTLRLMARVHGSTLATSSFAAEIRKALLTRGFSVSAFGRKPTVRFPIFQVLERPLSVKADVGLHFILASSVTRVSFLTITV